MTTKYSFTVGLRVGGYTRAHVVEVDELGADELSQCTDIAHEMLAELERAARRQKPKPEVG